MSARRGIFLAPFDELSDPGLVTKLAVRAEERGWDGFFVWDHIAYRAPVRAIADPWITLSSIAARTENVLLGPLVTPLARRRTHQLARETATLDRLSDGRLVFGAGLGGNGCGEFDPERFGEEPDIKVRAKLLDAGLERLAEFWAGEFEPRPVNGTIPVWVAIRWPFRKRPLERGMRHEGIFPIDQPGPEALAELVAAAGPGKEVVVTNPAGTDPTPWAQAGATWCLTGFGPQPTYAEVERAIDAL